MASPKAIPNDLLARYILGELPNGEREAVETAYFDNEDVHQQLLAVEEELFDGYASGELREGQRRRFEQIFRRIPDFESRLAFARAVREAADRAPKRKRRFGWLSRKSRKTGAAEMESRTRPKTGCALGTPKGLASSSSVWRRAAAPFGLLRIRWAVAAVAVLLCVVVGWLFVRQSNSNNSQATLPVLTYEVLPSIRGAHHPGANQSGNVIHLPNYPAIVRLRIPFNQPHTSPYLFVIETPEGEGKLSIPAQSTAENPNILTADLGPTSLEPGDYILSVVLENSLEPVAGFSVRITR